VGIPYADPLNTGQWADDLLFDLGDPTSASNVGYVEAWEQRESPSGFGYNPLGTEQPESGSEHAPGNTATVQAYRSVAQGLQATVATLRGNSKNASLENALASGDASLATLSAAQATPGASWATGPEKDITALGTSTAFTYGGTMGVVPGAAPLGSVAGDPTGLVGQTGNVLNGIGNALNPWSDAQKVATLPGDAAKSVLSGVLGPLVGWIEEGAADVTFIGFGLVLLVIGLVITFKGGDSLNLSSSSSNQPSSSSPPSGDVTRDAELAAA
jgi:hypothetical protein